MNFERLGGIQLFRSSVETEIAVRQEAERALRRNHKVGKYQDRDAINAILQEHFLFYDSMLKQLIPRVASRHFMEFVLAQYDFASQIEHKLKSNQLTEREAERWKKLGPTFRRAAKYLAECICMLAPNEAPQVEESAIIKISERCWICAEQMVELSILSTQTYALFPEETTLELRPVGHLEWFILQLDDPSKFEEFGERIRRDTTNRKNYINETEVVYSKQRVVEQLDDDFTTSCGFKVTDALAFASGLNMHTIQPGEGFDIPFVSEQQILSALTHDFGLTEEAARRLFDGICLRKVRMEQEGRLVWKPKQEYRAFTRPFFEFPHPTGVHFTWSREMATECLVFLFASLAQKRIPPEWQLGNVTNALEKHVASITEEFEGIVNKSLNSIGICAGRFKSSIGYGASAFAIPEDIGELDSLGYWPKHKLLIIGEDKFVKPTYEPATFRDDIDKFIDKKNNYVEQVKRKTQCSWKMPVRWLPRFRKSMGSPATFLLQAWRPH